jgi:hypothetical protein
MVLLMSAPQGPDPRTETSAEFGHIDLEVGTNGPVPIGRMCSKLEPGRRLELPSGAGDR